MLGEGLTRNLRGWALSPDALIAVMNYVLKYQPKVILELGGGYSTLSLLKLINKHNLKTKIISVDHDESYHNKLKDEISNLEDSHGIVHCVYAPLIKYKQGYRWYDTKRIEEVLNKLNNIGIDLAVVDGPPEVTNSHARQPALERLSKLFSKDFTIILDDAARDDERAAVESWLKLDKRLRHDYVHAEKGLSFVSTKDINPDILL